MTTLKAKLPDSLKDRIPVYQFAETKDGSLENIIEAKKNPRSINNIIKNLESGNDFYMSDRIEPGNLYIIIIDVDGTDQPISFFKEQLIRLFNEIMYIKLQNSDIKYAQNFGKIDKQTGLPTTSFRITIPAYCSTIDTQKDLFTLIRKEDPRLEAIDMSIYKTQLLRYVYSLKSIDKGTNPTIEEQRSKRLIPQDGETIDFIYRYIEQSQTLPLQKHWNPKYTTKNNKVIVSKKINLNEPLPIKTSIKTQEAIDCDLQLLQTLLAKYPNDDYANWMNICFIIKNNVDDDTTGAKLFHFYSSRFPKYDQGAVQKKWDEVKPQENGLKVGSLIKMCRDEGVKGLDSLLKSNLSEIIQIDQYGFKDTQLARQLMSLTKDNFLVIKQNKQTKKSYEIYAFENNKWIDGDAPLQRFISNEFRTHLLDKYKDFFNFESIKNLINEKVMSDTSKSKIINQFKNESHVKKQEFDTNPWLLGFENGVLDLKTKEFRKMRFDDFMMKSCGYDYVGPTKEQLDEIDSIFKTIFPIPEERRIYLIILATCLTGIQLQRFIIFWGNSSNGKSFMDDFLALCLGTKDENNDISGYQSKIPTALLCEPLKSGNNQDLANCHKARFIIAQEVNSDDNKKGAIKALDNGTIKTITGSTEISATGKFATGSVISLHSTLILECNDIPPYKSAPKEGEIRRTLNLLFRSKFVSPTNEELLKEPFHFPKIAKYGDNNWRKENRSALITYLLDYIGYENELEYDVLPQGIKQFTAQYIQGSSPFNDFMLDNYKISANIKDTIGIKEIFDHYRETKNIITKSQKEKCPKKKFIDWIKLSDYSKYLTKNIHGVFVLTNIIKRSVL